MRQRSWLKAVRSMEGLASTRRCCAHALDEPSTALLLVPDGRKAAGHPERAAFGCENGLRIRASLLDSVAMRNRSAELHFVSKHLVARERFQESLDGSTADHRRLPFMRHEARRLEHG